MPEISASAVSGAEHKAEDVPKDKTTNTAPTGPARFKRNFFMLTPPTTGAETKPLEAKKKGKEKEEKPERPKPTEWVNFSSQTRTDFTNLLDNLVTNVDFASGAGGGSDIFKFNPVAKDLLGLIGPHAETKADDKTLKSNIDAVLNQAGGWVATRMLLDQSTTEGLFVLGLVSSAELSEKTTNPMDLITDKEPTKVRRLDRIRGKGRLESAAVGFGVAGATTYGVNKLLETGIAGTVGNAALDAAQFLAGMDRTSIMSLTAAVGGALVGRYLGKEPKPVETGKEEPGFEAAKMALDAVKGNKEYAAYIKATWKVDINDFDWDEATQSIKNIARTKTTNQTEAVLDGVRSNLVTRDRYLDDLGVPPEARDIMCEQFIIEDDPTGYERTGERYKADVQTRYEALGAGEDPLDNSKNLELYRQARELVLTDYTERLIQKIEQAPTKSTTVIQEKIDDRKNEDGRIIREKRAQAAKDAPELQSLLDESFNPRVKVIEAYEEAQKQLKEAEDRLSRYIPEIFKGGITDIDEALQALKNLREQSGTSQILIFEGSQKTISSIADQKDRAAEFLSAEQKRIRDTDPKHVDNNGNLEPEDAYERRIEPKLRRVQERYETMINKIDEDNRIISGIQGEIASLQLAIKTNKESLEPKGEVAIQRHTAIYARSADRDRAWKLTQNPEVNDLLLKSTPSEILKKINELYKSDPTFGWEEADNEDFAKDQILAYALTMARAIKEDGDAIRGFLTHDNVGTIANEGVTFEQLETLSIPELENLLSATGLDAGQITEAQVTVREFASRMTKAIRSEREDLGLRIRRAERLAASEDLSKDVAILEITKDAMGKQGSVFGISAEFVSNVSERIPLFKKEGEPDRLQRFSDLTAREKGKYTPAEQQLAKNNPGIPVAYFEMLNIFFDYKGKSDTEERFTKISKVLSPKELGEILKEIAPDRFKGKDLTETLFKLQDNIRKGLVTRRAVRKMFEGVIEDLEAQALAMP